MLREIARKVAAAAALVVVAAVGFLLWKQWQAYDRLRGENARLWAEIAEKDSLLQFSGGVMVRLARERESLTERNEALRAALDSLDARARHLTKLVLHWRALAMRGTAVETVYVDTSGRRVHQVCFEANGPGVTVKGCTRTPPPTYELSIERRPIPVTVIVAQNPQGKWFSFVDSPDTTVQFDLPLTWVYPYRPPAWRRLRPFVGLGAVDGYVSALVGIQLGKFAVAAQWTPFGRGFFVMKQFALWEPKVKYRYPWQ